MVHDSSETSESNCINIAQLIWPESFVDEISHQGLLQYSLTTTVFLTNHHGKCLQLDFTIFDVENLQRIPCREKQTSVFKALLNIKRM